MDEVLELVCNALEELANSISSSEKRPLVEVQGWHNPSINFEELSNIPRYLAKEIRKAGIQEIISEELYRVTTSKGLAGAFEVRANKLSVKGFI